MDQDNRTGSSLLDQLSQYDGRDPDSLDEALICILHEAGKPILEDTFHRLSSEVEMERAKKTMYWNLQKRIAGIRPPKRHRIRASAIAAAILLICILSIAAVTCAPRLFQFIFG